MTHDETAGGHSFNPEETLELMRQWPTAEFFHGPLDGCRVPVDPYQTEFHFRSGQTGSQNVYVRDDPFDKIPYRGDVVRFRHHSAQG